MERWYSLCQAQLTRTEQVSEAAHKGDMHAYKSSNALVNLEEWCVAKDFLLCNHVPPRATYFSFLFLAVAVYLDVRTSREHASKQGIGELSWHRAAAM